MSTDVMIVEEAEYEEGEEERSVAVDSTSTAVGSADSEDENNSEEVDDELPDDAVLYLGRLGNGGDMLPWTTGVEPPLPGDKGERHAIEGSWRLISSHNYDKFLSAIGVTPLMAAMVQRTEYMFTVFEDVDRGWKLLGETSIKARSIRGYRCRNYKMTANKFVLGEPKPEVLEDWDPRLVVTTVTFEDGILRLEQQTLSEDGAKLLPSTSVTMAVNDDVLTMTLDTEIIGAPAVRAKRKFVRHSAKDGGGRSGGGPKGRKMSAPF